jgi:type I restriction enzyme S subunit
VTLHYGKALDKSDRNPDGSVPVYGANGVKDRSDKWLARGPSLIVGRKGSAGEITREDGLFWPLDVSYYTSHDSSRLDFDFLQYALRTLDLPSLARGVKPGINRNDVYALPIALPKLEEQKRIVAVLDQAFAALDRARAHAEANLSDAKEFLESYVEGQLIASGGDVAALQALLDSGAITSHLDGNHGGDYPRKEEFISSGIPYISANCIVGQGIDFGRAKFLSRERAAQLRKGIAQDRDVIFAHNATVGPVALLQTHYDKVILGTSLTYYRCEPNKILPEFLVYEMRSANFRLQYEAVMKQATRNQVPITAQRKFSHTIPSIAEQRRIVEQCSEIERLSQRLVEHYAAELTDLANLRQSLLQKAFSGELT